MFDRCIKFRPDLVFGNDSVAVGAGSSSSALADIRTSGGGEDGEESGHEDGNGKIYERYIRLIVGF